MVSNPGGHAFIIIVDQPLTMPTDKECNLIGFSGTAEWSVDGPPKLV